MTFGLEFVIEKPVSNASMNRYADIGCSCPTPFHQL